MTPVAIVGIGESRVGRLRGLSALRLTLESARAALQDAGLTASISAHRAAGMCQICIGARRDCAPAVFPPLESQRRILRAAEP